MRTEVKIGIIVGLIVIGLSVIFFVNQAQEAGGEIARELPMDSPEERVAPPSARPAGPRAQPRAERRPIPRRPSPTDVARRPAARAAPGERPARSTPGDASPRSTTPLVGQPRPTTQPTRAVPTPRTPVTPARRPTRQPPVARRTDGTARPIPPTPGRRPADAGARRRAAETTPRRAAPGRATTPAAARGTRRHTIVIDDSLWSIAVQYYDDGTLWPHIKAANPELDERRLPVGQIIVIPPLVDARRPVERTERTPAPAPPPARDTEQPPVRRATYVVERGDTLTKIARNILKDPTRWREIWELNKDKIPNPDVVPIGTALKLPAD